LILGQKEQNEDLRVEKVFEAHMRDAGRVDDEHGGSVDLVVGADDGAAAEGPDGAVQSVRVHEHGHAVVQVLKPQKHN